MHEIHTEPEGYTPQDSRPNSGINEYTQEGNQDVEAEATAGSEREVSWKKRYYASVGKLARERDAALKRLEEQETVVETLVERKLAERENARHVREERQRAFEENPVFDQYAREISGVKTMFPAMSWNEAGTFYLANHAPQALANRSHEVRAEAQKLHVPAYPSLKLHSVPDMASMSAKEYRTFLDELVRTGQITL